MDITPLVPEGKQIIQRYGNHQFKVSGEVYPHSVILLPNEVLPWEISAEDTLSFEHFLPLIEADAEVEVLLIGTGKTMQFITPELRQAFKAHNIAIDSMDTGAACRTYNVLLSEERRVAAALISVR